MIYYFAATMCLSFEVGAVMEILEMAYKNLLYNIFNFSILCYISTLLEIC